VFAPIVHTEGTLTVAVKGRPSLGATQPFDAATAGRKIWSLFRERGPRCLGDLRGSFALVALDRQSRAAVLAIDRMGIETLAWTVDGATLTFGTSTAAVARARSGGHELNHQAIFDFMLGHMVAAPDTAYVGVAKLLPGAYLLAADGRVESQRYWVPQFDRVNGPSVEELRKEVLPTLGRAVERCLPDDKSGSFLSGGLDSSTVTGLLAKTRGAPTDAFSVGFGVDEYDEMSYARIASQRFSCKHHIYEVTADDVVEVIPSIAAAYDEPFGNSSAVPTFCCARFAKQHGMNHLLAGDGGDEIFGGNSRYVRQQIFELYGKVPSILRTNVLDPLAQRIDPAAGPWPLRKLSSYIRQALVPLPERLESWNLIYREGAAKVFTPEFLATVDPIYPLQKMREWWESCPSTEFLDRMLWYDWKITLADNDLRKVSRMSELAGIRVSYPMLDEDLIDLSIRVPSAAKISRGRLRAFFKDAVRGFLPEQILRKTKHGFGLPFGQWLKTHAPLQDLVHANLKSLSNRGMLDPTFIARIEREHQDGHASYYGYAIWDMVLLEQWLRKQSTT